MDIGMIGAKQAFRSLDGKLFDDIDVLAATIVTFVGIALSIFVGEHASLCFHHGRVGEVLRCDELDVAFLALTLCGDCG